MYIFAKNKYYFITHITLKSIRLLLDNYSLLFMFYVIRVVTKCYTYLTKKDFTWRGAIYLQLDLPSKETKPNIFWQTMRKCNWKCNICAKYTYSFITQISLKILDVAPYIYFFFRNMWLRLYFTTSIKLLYAYVQAKYLNQEPWWFKTYSVLHIITDLKTFIFYIWCEPELVSK